MDRSVSRELAAWGYPGFTFALHATTISSVATRNENSSTEMGTEMGTACCLALLCALSHARPVGMMLPVTALGLRVAKRKIWLLLWTF